MSGPLKLIIFDVDGTLVDSQNDIVAAMSHAFCKADLVAPSKSQVLSIVGLSLDHAMRTLAPDAHAETHLEMVEWYKEAYTQLRSQSGAAQSSPLYPGALRVLKELQNWPETLLGIATGKSRRGLDKLMQAHDLYQYFINTQVSDHHPSKPHPAMLLAALEETGVEAEHAVMIGDTSFDMDMAKAAGIRAIGVTWGYHSVEKLHAADTVIDRFDDLTNALEHLMGNFK